MPQCRQHGGMFTTVVVGVDGSLASRAALRWGAEEAERHGAELVAVLAWHYPLAAMVPLFGSVAPVDALDASAAAGLHQVVLEELGPDTAVHEVTAWSSAADALVEQIGDHTLIVVGRDNHSPVADALHLSTDDEVRRTLRCPVAVIRA
jgi:nucleotide-binding universal stress UspA family protein